uniref:Secreted protein n=1 Tax=Steinernema glaseri TaxID=37863 RepID=A0A1I7ZPU4_9BILA
MRLSKWAQWCQLVHIFIVILEEEFKCGYCHKALVPKLVFPALVPTSCFAKFLNLVSLTNERKRLSITPVYTDAFLIGSECLKVDPCIRNVSVFSSSDSQRTIFCTADC